MFLAELLLKLSIFEFPPNHRDPIGEFYVVVNQLDKDFPSTIKFKVEYDTILVNTTVLFNLEPVNIEWI